MMRLIGILFLVFLIYLAIKAVLGFAFLFRKREQAKRRIKERQGGEMVEDPMCHTYVPKSTAVQRTISGHTVYFCGQKCAAGYLKEK